MFRARTHGKYVHCRGGLVRREWDWAATLPEKHGEAAEGRGLPRASRPLAGSYGARARRRVSRNGRDRASAFVAEASAAVQELSETPGVEESWLPPSRISGLKPIPAFRWREADFGE